MKRGDIVIGEIKSCDANGMMVYLKNYDKTLLLPPSEIKGGIKKKHTKMIGWFIPLRIKTLRPLSISNMRLDVKKLLTAGFVDANAVETVGVNKEKIEQVKTSLMDKQRVVAKKQKVSAIKARISYLPYGFMVWWEECESAARYTVKLFAKQQELIRRDTKRRIYNDKYIDKYQILCEVENDRRTFFYSFTNLADIRYELEPQYDGYGRFLGNYRKETGISYCIEVVAEDREEKVIASSGKISCGILSK